jgi:hypothetical protein
MATMYAERIAHDFRPKERRTPSASMGTYRKSWLVDGCNK